MNYIKYTDTLKRQVLSVKDMKANKNADLQNNDD